MQIASLDAIASDERELGLARWMRDHNGALPGKFRKINLHTNRIIIILIIIIIYFFSLLRSFKKVSLFSQYGRRWTKIKKHGKTFKNKLKIIKFCKKKGCIAWDWLSFPNSKMYWKYFVFKFLSLQQTNFHVRQNFTFKKKKLKYNKKILIFYTIENHCLSKTRFLK